VQNVTVSIAHTYIYSPLNVTAHAPVIVNVTDNHQKYIPSFQSAVDVTIFSYMPAIHYTTGWPEFPANRTEFPNRDLSMLYPDEQQYVSATTKHWWDVEWTWMGMDGYAWEMGVLILAVLILCAVIAFGVLAKCVRRKASNNPREVDLQSARQCNDSCLVIVIYVMQSPTMVYLSLNMYCFGACEHSVEEVVVHQPTPQFDTSAADIASPYYAEQNMGKRGDDDDSDDDSTAPGIRT
jgi:hypothetical protein